MIKALGNSLRMIKMGQSLDIVRISKTIEINFSGIYTQKVIEKMLRKEQKLEKRFAEDKKPQEGGPDEDESEKKRREEEKERRRQEKIRKIREKQMQKGYETKQKGKLKNTSQMLFKRQYLNVLKHEKNHSRLSIQQKRAFLTQHNVIKIIRANVMMGSGRYLMLFYDNGLTLSILYKQIRRIRSKAHFMLGSKLDFDIKSNQYAIEKIKRIKYYASQGFLIIMKDLENIYGVLYDLFNQRFSEESGSKVGHTCFVTYEDFKEPILIHPDFRIILLKSENDLISDSANIERKLPSPLVNRFQKHVLLLPNITRPENMEKSTQFMYDFEAIFDFDKTVNKGFKAQKKQRISNLVFCYKGGGLVHSLGLSPDVSNSDDFQQRLVRFYSIKMLMLHCFLLKDDQDSIEQLKQQFIESHPFESLADFVNRPKSDQKTRDRLKFVKNIKRLTRQLRQLGVDQMELDEEGDEREVKQLKKELKEQEVSLRKANVTRSIVMTNSLAKKTRFEQLGEASFGINEIDQNGTDWLEEELRAFLNKGDEAKLFVVEVNDSRKAHLVEYIKRVIDNVVEGHFSMSRKLREAPGQRGDAKPQVVDKEVVIIFFKPLIFEINKDTSVFDIEYFDDNWRYQVIDNLEGSFYNKNLIYLTESSEEIFLRIRNGQCSDLLTTLFMEAVKDMEVRTNFEDFLKNHILPTLHRQIELLAQNEQSGLKLSQEIIQLSVLDDTTQPQTTRLKIIRLLGNKIFAEIDTKAIVDWREQMFEDQFTFENVVSIQECVIRICRSEFARKLKFMLKHVVQHFGISSVLTIQNLPQDCAQVLEAVFMDGLEEFMQQKR